MLWMVALLACTPSTNDPTGPCGTWYTDADGDGFGDELRPVEVCAPDFPAAGLVTRAGDCDDDNPDVRPDTIEVCDPLEVDEDCSGAANDEDPGLAEGILSFVDDDGDGVGTAAESPVLYCNVPNGWSAAQGDCDDDDVTTFPGSAELEGASLCTTDGDGDGWGATEPNPAGVAGLDCDDTDPAVSPDGVEQLSDNIDQDCNGFDDFYIYDGFEAGSVNADAVDELTNAVVTELDGAYTGAGALRMGPGEARMVSREIGTVFDSDANLGCEGLFVSFAVRQSAVPSGDLLEVHAFDGSNELVIWQVQGDETVDVPFALVKIPLKANGYYRPSFQLRFETTALPGASFFLLDDFLVGCSGADGDGDGFGPMLDADCDDSDGRHWSDCGECVDADDDGFGDRCDQGPDCDDTDPDVFQGC